MVVTQRYSEEATVARFIVVICGRNSISQLYLRFVYTVKFFMFLVVVASASEMYVKINMPNFESLLRKETFSLVLD